MMLSNLFALPKKLSSVTDFETVLGYGDTAVYYQYKLYHQAPPSPIMGWGAFSWLELQNRRQPALY